MVSREDACPYYHEMFEKDCVVVKFFPLNALEKTLVSAKVGATPMKEFIATLLVSEIAVPSTTEMQTDGSGLTPLFFNKEGIGMLVAFTDKSRISQLTNSTHYCLVLNAFDLLKRMPKEYGLVINPGSDAGFDISPSGIQEIIKSNWGQTTVILIAGSGIRWNYLDKTVVCPLFFLMAQLQLVWCFQAKILYDIQTWQIVKEASLPRRYSLIQLQPE